MSRVQTPRLRYLPSITPSATPSDTFAPAPFQAPAKPAGGPSPLEQVGRALGDFNPQLRSFFEGQAADDRLDQAESAQGALGAIQALEPAEQEDALIAVRNRNKDKIAKILKKDNLPLQAGPVFWSVVDEQTARLDLQKLKNKISRRVQEEQLYASDEEGILQQVISEEFENTTENVKSERYLAFLRAGFPGVASDINQEFFNQRIQYTTQTARNAYQGTIDAELAGMAQELEDIDFDTDTERVDAVSEIVSKQARVLTDLADETANGSLAPGEANQILASRIEPFILSLAESGNEAAAEEAVGQLLSSVKTGPASNGKRPSLGDTAVGRELNNRLLSGIDRIRARNDREEDDLSREERLEVRRNAVNQAAEAASQYDGSAASFAGSDEASAIINQAQIDGGTEAANAVRSQIQSMVQYEDFKKKGLIEEAKESNRGLLIEMYSKAYSLNEEDQDEALELADILVERKALDPSGEYSRIRQKILSMQQLGADQRGIIGSARVDQLASSAIERVKEAYTTQVQDPNTGDLRSELTPEGRLLIEEISQLTFDTAHSRVQQANENNELLTTEDVRNSVKSKIQEVLSDNEVPSLTQAREKRQRQAEEREDASSPEGRLNLALFQEDPQKAAEAIAEMAEEVKGSPPGFLHKNRAGASTQVDNLLDWTSNLVGRAAQSAKQGVPLLIKPENRTHLQKLSAAARPFIQSRMEAYFDGTVDAVRSNDLSKLQEGSLARQEIESDENLKKLDDRDMGIRNLRIAVTEDNRYTLQSGSDSIGGGFILMDSSQFSQGTGDVSVKAMDQQMRREFALASMWLEDFAVPQEFLKNHANSDNFDFRYNKAYATQDDLQDRKQVVIKYFNRIEAGENPQEPWEVKLMEKLIGAKPTGPGGKAFVTPEQVRPFFTAQSKFFSGRTMRDLIENPQQTQAQP